MQKGFALHITATMGLNTTGGGNKIKGYNTEK
jgi:hypothetical protein